MKILIVDDEPDVKTLFEQRFRREVKSGEIEMTFAQSGEEALEFLSAQSQHGSADVVLILSDINMPGMTGIELLRRIKAKMPAQKVFMITAYGDADTEREARQSGADDFLHKPLDFAALKARLPAMK